MKYMHKYILLTITALLLISNFQACAASRLLSELPAIGKRVAAVAAVTGGAYMIYNHQRADYKPVFPSVASIKAEKDMRGFEARAYGISDMALPSMFASKPIVIAPEDIGKYNAERAMKLYNEINSSGRFRYPAPGEIISTSSSLFIIYVEGQLARLKLKTKIPPSIALTDFFAKGGVVECTVAHNLIMQIISCELHGADTFDEAYKEDFRIPHPGVISIDILAKPLPTNIGEFGYFSNIADYRLFQNERFGNGENVFCVGKKEDGTPLYLGFGPFFTHPRTATEIIDSLYAAAINMDTAKNDQARDILGIYKQCRELWDEEREKSQAKYRAYLLTQKSKK